MAEITQMRSGRWQVRVRVGGTRLPAPDTFPTRAGAERWVRDNEARLRLEGPPSARTVSERTVAEWGELWWESRHAEPSTEAMEGSRLRGHVMPRWGHVDADAVRKVDVQRWAKQLRAHPAKACTDPDCPAGDRHHPQGAGLGVHSAAGCLSLLHRILDVAVEEGALPRNPAARVTIPPEARLDKRIFTRDEAERLLAAADTPTRQRRGPNAATRQPWLLCMVMLYTGLRWGEAIGLRARDVNVLKRRLDVRQVIEEVSGRTRVKDYPKTTAGHRTLPLTERLAAGLEQHLADVGCRGGALLFTTNAGNPLTRSTFREWTWLPALVDAGLATRDEDGRIVAVPTAAGDLLALPTPHSLRHTYISWLANSGNVPLDVVRRRAGHESILTTQGYLHEAEGEDEQVLQVLEGAPARVVPIRPEAAPAT